MNVSSTLSKPCSKTPRDRADDIVRYHAELERVKPDDIRDIKNRKPHIVAARHLAMLDIHECLGWSYRQVGRYFGQEHKTVLYAIGRAHIARGNVNCRLALRAADHLAIMTKRDQIRRDNARRP